MSALVETLLFLSDGVVCGKLSLVIGSILVIRSILVHLLSPPL
jgi:hypothetical protein